MMSKHKITYVFERKTKQISIDNIMPLRLVSAGSKKSAKYLQVRSSVKELGLVEPPVVARNKGEAKTYILLDGHLRLEALKELGVDTVECLIATDDEAFTYNKRISRIATIQEHAMILKAIERGVSEKRIAEVMNVNVSQIRLKRRLLAGICAEAAEMLKDKHVPLNTFGELRKMVATRQIEAAQLMVVMNKFSLPYAKSLVGATPQDQLVDKKPKKVSGLTKEQMDLMEQESAVLDREVRLIEETFGSDNLDLVVATRYVAKLLENAAVVRMLAQKFPELLSEFQRIAEMDMVSA